MAPDLTWGGWTSRRRGRVSTYRKLLWIGLLPFLFGLLTILVFSRHGELASKLRYLHLTSSTLQSQPSVNCTVNITKEGCNCSTLAARTVGNGTYIDELWPSSVDSGQRESVFLFIGILSGRGYRHRRLAVREAWANHAQVPVLSTAKFILSEDEMTPQVEKELEMHGDVVFVKEKTNYKSILFKTFHVFDYAVRHYSAKFVLKTDDDAFINVPPLIQQLQQLCVTPECSHERLYLGRMAKESEVLLQPGHKWNNIVFHNHTGLRMYPNYMMGGGYVVSGDVAAMLVDINQRLKLKFTPIEDATVGFWLMAMDLRHIDHPKFFSWAAPCCFKAPMRREGQRIVTRFQLVEEMEEDLCSDDPWLVLHKIDSPTKMRYIGTRVAACQPREEGRVAPSIQQFLQGSGELEAGTLQEAVSDPVVTFVDTGVVAATVTDGGTDPAGFLGLDPGTGGGDGAAGAGEGGGAAAGQEASAAAGATAGDSAAGDGAAASDAAATTA